MADPQTPDVLADAILDVIERAMAPALTTLAVLRAQLEAQESRTREREARVRELADRLAAVDARQGRP